MIITNEAKVEPFLFLYITEKCHLRCKHCYMGDRLESERHMSPVLVNEILSSLRILYGQYKVYLLGGEPTLHPNFNEILDICKQQNYKIVITSNGLIPEKQWATISPEQIDSFSFSFDGGTKETHEFMRGKNTFSKLLVSIKQAVKLGFQTRLIQTVTTKNIDVVKESLDLAEDLGVEMISFHYFTPTGYGLKSPELQLSPEEWIKFCKWLQIEGAQRNIKIFYPPAFIETEQIPNLQAAGYRGCTARNLERFAIFPDRRVYICSAFFDTEFHYGTFNEGRIIPRFDGSQNNELTLVNKVGENCVKCPNSRFCKAGCAAYDHFDKTLPSKDCSRSIMPICPLWSMPVKTQSVEKRFQDLR